LQAGSAEAGALYEANRITEARQLWSNLLPVAIAETDVDCQARLHNNLGYCETHLKDYVSANIHFSEAVALFTDLGFTAEVARTERGAGLVLIARGQITNGVARLNEARAAFKAAGVIDEAGLCSLRIVEVLIGRGEEAQARILTQSVIDEFITAGLDERAINAVVRLRDAIDVNDVTTETVRTVHAFVDSIRQESRDVAN
jgi:hypothetical protein